jgi:PadR family transcriptional regulator, regulatory protein PadR
MDTSEKFDLPQGTLDLLILRVVAMGPIHGYAIAQRIQQMSREALQVQQGSLYPALHRLEKQGWVKSEWKLTETGQRAKYYRLTPAGKKQLLTEHSRWTQLTQAIAGIMSPAPSGE